MNHILEKILTIISFHYCVQNLRDIYKELMLISDSLNMFCLHFHTKKPRIRITRMQTAKLTAKPAIVEEELD